MGQIKPRLGIFKLSCCSGCTAQMLYFQNQVADVLTDFDIVHCLMVQSLRTPDGPFDLALVEGAVTEPWQISELKNIRARSSRLMALGTCACLGGIPALKCHRSADINERLVYKQTSKIKAIEPAPITSYIKIDTAIRGCPPSESDLVEVLSSVLLNRQPNLRRHCVCVDCKLSSYPCLLVSENQPCLGPITTAGCGALCPSRHRSCTGCYGLVHQPNLKALKYELENRGVNSAEIIRLISRFNRIANLDLVGA